MSCLARVVLKVLYLFLSMQKREKEKDEEQSSIIIYSVFAAVLLVVEDWSLSLLLWL